MQWKGMVAVAIAAVALAIPAAAGAGATQTVETWSHVSGDQFFAGDGLCGTQSVAGPLTDGSGIVRITQTANGQVTVRGHSDDTWQLYEASGPPWDVTFGAYYGTMTVHVSFEELEISNGQGVQGSATNGTLVRADGSSQTVHILFRLLLPPDGPPKLFIVNFTCGG